MGNRAVVTTKSATGFNEDAIGVYLHWNGGRDSITAFLKYCELQGFTSPDDKYSTYGWSQFAQIVSNYFGGKTSLRIDKCKNLDCDNYDNGVYFIENWQIVGREFMHHEEQDEYPLKEMLLDIDEKQPEAMQIREKILMNYDDLQKVVLTIGGDSENGYDVVRIRVREDGSRHYSTVYHDSDYGKCLDWMNAHAANDGFAYSNTEKIWTKTA